jgi:hypothetical protein
VNAELLSKVPSFLIHAAFIFGGTLLPGIKRSPSTPANEIRAARRVFPAGGFID